MSSALAPVGVFDSGVGGLTVARAIIYQLPDEDIVYVGDTAHGPYGPLPIDEFRSIEVMLDDLCRIVMVPVVAAHDVEQRRTEFGSVPGILYTPTAIAMSYFSRLRP